MKYIFAIIVSLVLVSAYSCDDYIETGIEGRWQMTKIEKADGEVVKVDTIYYSFKKGVFQYLTLTTETTSIYVMGLYTEKNDSLHLELKEYIGDFNQWGLGVYTRGYKVEKQSSTKMTLNFEDDIYHFRKY